LVLLPLLETGALPRLVPPLVHVLGGEDCGPKTVKVTVPPAPAAAPERTAFREPGAISVPTTLD
jgi:hypothetical protein